MNYFLCRECGFYGCQCNKQQSHGMDYKDEVRKLDKHHVQCVCNSCMIERMDIKSKFDSENKHLDEDNAWGEFLEWQREHTQNVAFDYHEFKDYAKIGLLMTYIAAKEVKEKYSVVKTFLDWKDINVEYLEGLVRAIKPVDEVEELAIELFESASRADESPAIWIWNDCDKRIWRASARKAIEIIKGKA